MDKKIIKIKGIHYDITDYKHPGGGLIYSMIDDQDATNAFEEFHYRSKKAKIVLDSLPKTPSKHNPEKMLEDFEKFRKSLVERGFFKPSYTHITFRIIELISIYSVAVYLIPYNIIGSLFLFGIFGGRCGWLQHEGGHNSLTGNIKIDKLIQNISIGFGLLTDGSMWNNMHNRHHANTQKIGYDMDLDTTPLVAFYENATIDNTNKIVKYWLKYQAYTFLPITSGIFVMLFWILYLHPRKIIKDKNIIQGLIVIFGHLPRISRTRLPHSLSSHSHKQFTAIS
jgi:fatty acid desaturase